MKGEEVDEGKEERREKYLQLTSPSNVLRLVHNHCSMSEYVATYSPQCSGKRERRGNGRDMVVFQS